MYTFPFAISQNKEVCELFSLKTCSSQTHFFAQIRLFLQTNLSKWFGSKHIDEFKELIA